MATNISIPTYGFVNHILALNEGNWRRFFKPFITDSVQSGLATIAGANMTVYVSAGECRCGAVMGILDEMIALDVANGDSTYDRIDSVIVQYTYGEPSTLAVAIIQGTPSTNPVPPTLTKVYDTLWQMEIAQILVPSGATSSSEFTITDKRVIYESIESIIDDNTESEERVWSSQKSREEIVSLSTEIYDSLNTKADVIERTVSGDIVTITDGGNNLPVKELVVDIEPVQDLHGFDYPYPPSNVNIFNPANVFDGYISDNSHIITANESGTIYAQVIPGAIYTLTKPSSTRFRFGYTASEPQIGDEVQNYTRADSATSYSFQVPTGMNYFVAYIGTEEEKVDVIANLSIIAGNVCPISGWTSAVVTKVGKNVLDWSSFYSKSQKTRCSATLLNNGDINFTNTNSSNKGWFGCSTSTNNNNMTPSNCYTIPARKGDTFTAQFLCSYYGVDKNNIVREIASGIDANTPYTITNENVVKVAFRCLGTEIDAGTTGIIGKAQIERSSSASDYQPYNEQTVTIALGETRYGATLNVLTGMMTVTDGYIASYNGETLPSTWISDRDAYAEGTIPTIGAQVVYKLASPQTVQLSSSKIQTLLGTNHIFANTGNILNLTYRADMKTYVDEHVAEANLKTRQMMTTVTTKMVAPNNLVIGDIVIVNDDLYKVINSNIASGEAMVVGTNVEQITLTEYIQSLI